MHTLTKGKSPSTHSNINENKLVKHSITVVSGDTKHDSHAVEVFENKAIELLNDQEVEVDSIHKSSDGAAAQ